MSHSLGHCPHCHLLTLEYVYPQPPDYLTDEEYDRWIEDNEDEAPTGIRCVNCGCEED